MKFVLLHEGKNDEGIRGFFAEVWELYVKVCLLDNVKMIFFFKIVYYADDDEPFPHRSQYNPKQCF